MPSTAADIMPPAQPAPSPVGYSPAMLEQPSAPRSMRTGEDERVSTPVSTASGWSNPRSMRPSCGSASRMDSTAKPGRQSARSAGATPGR